MDLGTIYDYYKAVRLYLRGYKNNKYRHSNNFMTQSVKYEITNP